MGENSDQPTTEEKKQQKPRGPGKEKKINRQVAEEKNGKIHVAEEKKRMTLPQTTYRHIIIECIC